MAKIPTNKLDSLIADAGVDAKTAKKLHAANEKADKAPEERPRGHGSAQPATVDAGAF